MSIFNVQIFTFIEALTKSNQYYCFMLNNHSVDTFYVKTFLYVPFHVFVNATRNFSGKMYLAALTQLCHPQIQFQLRSMNLLKRVHKQPTAATLLKHTFLSVFDSQKNKYICNLW